MNKTISAGTSTVPDDKHIFGFWVYLMTDLIMFAALFATYAVLRDSTFGGASQGQLLGLSNALAETLILLTSSFTCGLAMLAVHAGARGGPDAARKKQQALAWFGVTFVLGATFLGLELREFASLAAAGNTPQANAALSAFFTLVGTHGLHIAVGLLWMAVSIVMIVRRGLTPFVTSKLQRLALFWHFLDIVWIFIFTIVYLMSHVIS
jgi:cytochrome o ubiquinol oxidase subunit III